MCYLGPGICVTEFQIPLASQYHSADSKQKSCKKKFVKQEQSTQKCFEMNGNLGVLHPSVDFPCHCLLQLTVPTLNKSCSIRAKAYIVQLPFHMVAKTLAEVNLSTGPVYNCTLLTTDTQDNYWLQCKCKFLYIMS